MKFQRLRDMIFGAVIASMVLCSGTMAFAKVANMSIPVSFNNIKIVVDGQQISTSKEPFTYEGATYLPVRAVAEAVGKDVSWDGATKTVYIGSKEVEQQQPITPTSTYSRSNPAPIGKTQTVTYNNYLNKYTAEVTIKETISGASAWNKIKNANMFNDEAPEGKEYILVKAEVKILSSEDDKAVDLSPYSFDAFSQTDVEYESPIIINPDPAFSGSVYKGGTMSGYITFTVDKTDDAPKVVFGKKFDGTGGVWFSIR